MGPRAGLDGRKILSPPGFDPGPSSPYSVAIPTELPGPHNMFNVDASFDMKGANGTEKHYSKNRMEMLVLC